MNYKISIVIPVYNDDKYLRECLDSIVHQTLKDFEIICVNDGSTDGTLSILKEYEQNDCRIRVITQKNQGQSSARNNALQYVSGKYVVFVDSDDFLDKNALCHLYARAEKYSLDMLSYGGVNFDSETKQYIHNPYYEFEKLPADFEGTQFNYKDCASFLTSFAVSCCLTMYRSDFIKTRKILFPEGLFFEDNLFFIKGITQAKTIGLLREKLYYRRVHSNQTTSNWEKIFNDYIKISDLVLMYLNQIHIEPKIYNAYLRLYLGNCLNRFNKYSESSKEKYYKGLKDFIEKYDKRLLSKINKPASVTGENEIGKMKPQVSVVIPIHNVEKFLPACLNSVINQSLRNIEIICVNDASEDNCLEIIRNAAQKDSRVKIINFKNNLGTSQARKEGVLASTGEYVMFLDGDDEYFPCACEIAYKSINKTSTDMLQFDTEVVNLGGFPEQRIKGLQKYLFPCVGKVIENAIIVEKVWKERAFGFTLWNKIYKGDICRKAFSLVSDGYFPKAQDLYAFFIIADHSKSYSAIPNKLYKYNLGVGVTGGDIIPLQKYEVILGEKKIYDALVDYVIKHANNNYDAVIDAIYNNLIDECIAKWANHISPNELSEAFSKLIATFGAGNVLVRMATKYWYNYCEIGKKLCGVDFISQVHHQNREIINVAVLYHRICNGAAERTTAELCNLLNSATDGATGSKLFKVILITDEGLHSEEYQLNDSIKREYLPPINNSVKEKYSSRYNAWKRILDANEIDVVVSGHRDEACTFWDILTAKLHQSKPAFTVFSHSFCANPYKFNSSESSIRHILAYMLCDGVVTGSEVDKNYAETFSNNVLCIYPTIRYNPKLTSESVYQKNILFWNGTISSENNPLDCIRMMSFLVREIPDAKLFIIGTGEHTLLTKSSVLIENLELNANIKIVGFAQGASEYYSKAAVFISTSNAETSLYAINNAKAHAIPVVAYDLPWFPHSQDSKGLLTVEQGRYDDLAKKVGYLLKNPEEARRIGLNGKKQLIDLYQYNTPNGWKEFFIKALKGNVAVDEQEIIGKHNIVKYIAEYQYEGRKKEEAGFRSKINELNNQINELKTRIDELTSHIKDAETSDTSTLSAYIELKSNGDHNSLEIVNLGKEKISRAPWYDDESGLGYRVKSNCLVAEIDVICHGAGTLNVICRGLDVRDPKNSTKRVPIWVIFTSLVIDGQEYINSPIDVWHNRPYRCSVTVDNKQKVHILAEWVPKRHSIAGLLGKH